jgi:vitamin B12 transporter
MTRRPALLTSAIVALLGAASTARAQRSAADTAVLAPVVVTATRVPVEQNASTSSTTVMTGDALRARGITTVLQALRDVPGVTVAQAGSFGAQTSLFLRGGESKYVQVLVDGVSINDPGGDIDLATLTTDNVDRIEILRGPASVLYGSNAVSGVVQIFTRRGRAHAPRIEIGVRGGGYDSRDVDASVSRAWDVGSVSLAGARHTSDGIFAFNSGYRNTVLSGGARFAPDARTDIRLSLRSTDAATHIPTNSFGAVVDSNQFHTERRFTGSLDAGRFLTAHLEARVLLGESDERAHSENLPDSPGDSLDFYSIDDSRVSRRNVDARLNIYLSRTAVITAGAAYEAQRERSADSTLGAFGGRTTFDPRRTNRALYAEAVGNVGRAASFTAGARLDDNEAFGSFGTYRVGGAYRFSTGTRLHASIGTAFREPTFFENFATGFVRGNPELEPERTRSWEAGVAQALMAGRVTVSATYFDQHFRDMIQYNPAPASADAPNYINVAAANASGVEFGVHASPTSALDVAASYTLLDTRVTDAGMDEGPSATFVQGERLLRRPSHLASVTVGYQFTGRGSMHVDVQHVGDRDDRFFRDVPATPVTLPAYSLVNLAGEIDVGASGWTRDLTLTARVDNVFDTRYQQVFNYAAPGRVVRLGARVGLGW